MIHIYAKLIIFLPLISGVINGLLCQKINKSLASIISVLSMSIASVCSFIIFIHSGIDKNVLHIIIANWINIDSLTINWAIYVDQLTAIMFVVVTVVSAVVHIYSLGYMADDNNLPKFLSFLSLFTFFMLALVSADNFLQLFFGWEGVGLCSYLLIGYYFYKESANDAAIKAFVVNRVGDLAFILGIVIIWLYTGSVEFKIVFMAAEELASNMLNIFDVDFILLDVICLLLFIGCTGKSAQIGMHVWLPDAMEGPTPVSALIHAATMVTAGVFLLARCSFLFEYSPSVLYIITIIGAVTCLFAACVAIAQSDIKKIIAYSTCSQLGYMFFACGVSAYGAGIFHLATHGFFKALLFLSAGSVIHAVGEQDLFKMGGLRKKMPITYVNFCMGSLAIIGIFPFAGFYSKDLILESAYGSGGVGNFAFVLGIIAAVLTAIYSIKIILLTFHGTTKLSEEAFDHTHESPKIMNLPLIALIAGTLFSGMIGFYMLNIGNNLGFFHGSIFNLKISHDHHASTIIETLPLIIGIIGILIGIWAYNGDVAKKIANGPGRFLYYIFKNRFFFDEIYSKLIVQPIKFLSTLSGIIDIQIDRTGPGAVSMIARGFSWSISYLQTGYLYNYAFYIIFSLVSCITVFVLKYQTGGV
jgi:NADH-quinone oxidoreductase subunit L